MNRLTYRALAVAVLTVGPVLAVAPAEAVSVKGPQRPPSCSSHRCPVKVTPSPGPFVVGTPGRKSIPRPPMPR